MSDAPATVSSNISASLDLTATWERLKGESARAYAVFCVYRDLGPQRTAREAARRFYPGLTSGRIRQVEAWSSAFHWVARAQAYDAHQDQIRREAASRAAIEQAEERERARLAHREAEQEIVTQGFDKLRTLLRLPLVRTTQQGPDGSITVIEPVRWTLRDVATLLTAVSKVGRLALDMETSREVSDVTQRAADPADGLRAMGLTEDDVRALVAYAKANGPDGEEG